MPLRSPPASLSAQRGARAALLLATLGGLGALLGGCVTDGPAASGLAGGATVAFESIDGPPPQVFDRIVSMIESESKLRRVAVVSRQGQATYRVRSYLSAQVRGGRTNIAWVWDVYDRNQQRALRVSGMEPAGKPGSDAWAQADDLVLRRITQAGISGLSEIINGTATPPAGSPPADAPTPNNTAVASADAPATSHSLGPATLSLAAR
ncbi:MULTISPECIES: hypothetical protein [Rhodopseudomonas]|uniref:Signal peptide protein n=1 Tax=Rhodopseudomonas palustris TaxID=1076 RepID=A0A0D7EW43_RHOPL|nr:MULTISPECIES: hypothetical protein [Rhodopseudomonas]KIZ43672.1 signal peptide protein [Rhodopseudomonas palustris]MDF3810869.1 hypothetical protein [Rhodopseudomonas sp. BAL398]WOK15564.1 hypothetical protein RBJ75_15355 [Rhodopseudomonas sp. BAL398]